ncbi:MAG: transcription termination factor NusA [Thomasclavelia sp.]|uniref:transcription termination factor NusA n=1 Tax=Thomasclavelia sp. TaxID=3025757 RepID=UPI0039A39BAD
MASKKFMDALNLLIEEKGIEKDVFLEMLKESIAKAYKKNYLNPDANVRVEINEKTGKFRLFEIRTVVDDLDDEDIELSLEEAQAINPFHKIGDVVETEADVEHIGRLAAIQTKQLFRQKIRETEKETLYNEFADKKDDIITGIVDRVEDKFAIVNIGKTGAFLAINQQIPGERIKEGQHLKVYVSDVDRGTKGTHIVVSRTEPNFVKRLFELEVPEVYDGTVEIKAVSREPGERSKVAVYTSNESVDPIGSCVGPKGSRVKNVVDELNGEMIDIIIWSSDPVVFISNALSPSEVKHVAINENDHSALVVVPDDQLSLAIGKRGQNARLAVRLTGWKIDIKSVSEALELGLITLEDITIPEDNSPVDSNFEEEFAQEMLEKTSDEVIDDTEEEIIEEEIIEEVVETAPVKKVIEYEDFEDLDDEYSKYDEEIDYDEYDKYYDAD